MTWVRARIHTAAPESEWPARMASGPYWVSGWAADDSYTVIVGWFRGTEEVERLWRVIAPPYPVPWIDICDERSRPVFYERFPCPPDWDETHAHWRDGAAEEGEG